MNDRTRREIAATLLQQNRRDLARHFTKASRVDKVLLKHQQNMLADLRLMITKSGAAPNAQKKTLQSVIDEMKSAVSRMKQQLDAVGL